MNIAPMIDHLDVIIANFTSKWLHLLYGVTSFFNLSTHRLRMMLSVRQMLEECVRIGEPTHADTLYAEVAVDHFVRWMGVAQRENKHGKDDSTSRSQRLQLVRRFFEIVVSGYGTQHIIVRNMSLMDDLVDTIVDTMVQPQFPTPSGKN